jgi:mannose-6-phosphate isomerase-like protein (cupin superfamily)
VDRFRLEEVAARLGPGGYEVVFDSPTLEVGVYVLIAPEPDTQEPHEEDEIYVVLDGEGVLTVAGQETRLTRWDAAFVGAGTDHRFSAYDRLTLLVLFDKTTRAAA